MAIGFLAAVPISIGIAVGVILRHIGRGRHRIHPAHALLAQAGQ